MSGRWRDYREPGFIFQSWMRTVDDLEDVIEGLVSALNAARPYVKGTFDQLSFTTSQHIPAAVLGAIDAALAKAEQDQ
jgi:hypothetical protein